MTVASEISKLETNLQDSYTAVSDKGGVLPVSQNFDNLPTAIESIEIGGGGDVVTIPDSNFSQDGIVLFKYDTNGNPEVTGVYTYFSYTGKAVSTTELQTVLPNPIPYLPNYTVNGSVTINQDLSASGWSTANYVDTNYTPSGNYSITFKGSYSTTGIGPTPVNGVTFNGSRLANYENGWRMSNCPTSMLPASSFVGWIKRVVVNGIAFIYHLPDTSHKYNIDSLPPLNDWICTYVISVSKENATWNSRVLFGTNGTQTGTGTLNLDQSKICRLDVDNKKEIPAWRLYSPISTAESDIDILVPSGEWRTAGSDGVLYLDGKGFKGFTNVTNIVPLNFKWSLANATSVSIKAHFKTPATISTSSHTPLVAYSTNTINNPCYIYIHNSLQALYGSPFGQIIPAEDLKPDTEYWIDVSEDSQGNRVKRFSLDGKVWAQTTDVVPAPAWGNYTDTITIGYWGSGSTSWSGTIYDVELSYVDSETHTFKLWK